MAFRAQQCAGLLLRNYLLFYDPTHVIGTHLWPTHYTSSLLAQRYTACIPLLI